MRLTRFTALLILILIVFAPKCGESQRIAPSHSTSPRLQDRADPYIPHLPERALAYHRANRVLLCVGIGWHILGLVLLLRSGASAAYRDLAHNITRRPGGIVSSADPDPSRAPTFVSVAGYYILYSVTLMTWTLPIGLAGLAIERKFGFSNQSVGLYFKDQALSLAIGWGSTVLIWIAYRIYARWPAKWWLWLWMVIVPINAFATVVYPVIISPLYNRYTPLVSGRLRDQILDLAGKAGIHNSRVFVEDTSRRTSHVNAYVTGIGPSTRIVINDTALRQLPDDQILAIVGHEMGHYAEHHVLINLCFGAIGSGLMLALLASVIPRIVDCRGRKYGLKGPGDLAALPLILLTIYLINLGFLPITSACSRELEHRADIYGLRITGLKEANARLMVGFAERDLGDPDPPPILHLWFGTHPTLKERIDFALKFH